MKSDIPEIAACWRRQRPELDERGIELSMLIKRLGDAIERETRAVSLATADIGPGDARILLALRRSGPDTPMRQNALLRSLLITSGAVSKQVDRLERSGLLERLADPVTGRTGSIRLTGPGRETADRIMDNLFTPHTRLGRALAGLDRRERDLAIRALHALTVALAGDAD